VDIKQSKTDKFCIRLVFPRNFLCRTCFKPSITSEMVISCLYKTFSVSCDLFSSCVGLCASPSAWLLISSIIIIIDLFTGEVRMHIFLIRDFYIAETFVLFIKNQIKEFLSLNCS